MSSNGNSNSLDNTGPFDQRIHCQSCQGRGRGPWGYNLFLCRKCESVFYCSDKCVANDCHQHHGTCAYLADRKADTADRMDELKRELEEMQEKLNNVEYINDVLVERLEDLGLDWKLFPELADVLDNQSKDDDMEGHLDHHQSKDDPDIIDNKKVAAKDDVHSTH